MTSLRRVVPFLTAGQILLMIPGCLSTAYALGRTPADGVIFAEAESNFIDRRICAPGEISGGLSQRAQPHRCLPAQRAPGGQKQCSTGWARRLSISKSVAEAAPAQPEHDRAHGRRDHDHPAHRGHERRLLHVPRGVHAVGLECSEALDGEKMRVLERLGQAGRAVCRGVQVPQQSR